MENKRSIVATMVGWLEIVVGVIVAAAGVFLLLIDVRAMQSKQCYGWGFLIGFIVIPGGLFTLTAGILLLKSKLAGKIMTIIVCFQLLMGIIFNILKLFLYKH